MSAQEVLVFLILLAECYYARGVMLAVVATFFLAILVDPAVGWLVKTGLRRGWAACLAVLVFWMLLLGACWILVEPFSKLAFELPQYSSEIKEKAQAIETRVHGLEKSAENAGGQKGGESGQGGQGLGAASLSKYLLAGVGSIFEAAGIAAFMPVLMAFVLIEKRWLLESLRDFLGGGFDFSRMESETASMVRAYFFGGLIAGLGMGVVQWGVFAGLGLRNAIGLGLMTGLVNTLPVIGLLIALTLPALQALLQSAGKLPLVIIGAVVISMHVITGSFVLPRVIGTRLRLNETAATVAILVFAVVWGLVGFMLALPLTALLRIVLESHKGTAPAARLLESNPRKEF